jgi:6-pyruvoyltetrahydropterin/6-carboxytetrahydropterin synthase
MYTLCVSDFVMVAHSLAGEFFGPAQRMHGATLSVDAELRTQELESHGVVMDIGVLRTRLRAVLDGLDYQNLDEHTAFAPRASTTERITKHICDALAASLVELPQGSSLRVVVRESPVAWVAFERPL